MNHTRIKLAWCLMLLAVAACVISFVLTNSGFSLSGRSSVSTSPIRRTLQSGFGDNTDPVPLHAAARLLETASTGATGSEFAGRDLPQNLPLEWEDEFFGIFDDDDASTDEVDRRLIELATEKAVGEPRVQLECLRHLAYSLPDDAEQIIMFVATNRSIPLTIRVYFLELALSMRPTEVAEKITNTLPQGAESELAAAARGYIEKVIQVH
jgi:hypothetical protein